MNEKKKRYRTSLLIMPSLSARRGQYEWFRRPEDQVAAGMVAVMVGDDDDSIGGHEPADRAAAGDEDADGVPQCFKRGAIGGAAGPRAQPGSQGFGR